jgi:hypothetical protein
MPRNADALVEADRRVRLLPNEDVEASSSRAERLRFEMDDSTEGGRTGTDSSSLSSGASAAGVVGGPIPPAAVVVLLLGAISGVFAMAPRVCSEGRKACMPLTMAALGMSARIRSKCTNPFALNGAASLFFYK